MTFEKIEVRSFIDGTSYVRTHDVLSIAYKATNNAIRCAYHCDINCYNLRSKCDLFHLLHR